MQTQRQEYANYIWLQGGEVLVSLWGFLSAYSLFLVLGYCLIIILIAIVLRYMYKTYMHIAQVLQKSIDTCLYSQSLFIYQNRHNIYNLSESLPILYAHTQLMLADPSSRDYITIYPQLKKDIEYTEQFFSSSLNIQWKDSDMLYHLAYSMQDRYLLMKNTLKYLTFGLSRFFS